MLADYNAAHLVNGHRGFRAMHKFLAPAEITPSPSPSPELATPTPAAIPTSEPTTPPYTGYGNYNHCDIGDVAHAGSASYTDGVFTIAGSGADFYYNAYEFHYVYWPLRGDGAISARVCSLTNTHIRAKAGVMVRESLDPGSWGYNAYKYESVSSGSYGIEFSPDSGNPPESIYELRIVVYDEQTGQRTYYSLHNVPAGGTARIDNIIANGGEALYFIVAATPDILSGFNERYSYHYRIYPH